MDQISISPVVLWIVIGIAVCAVIAVLIIYSRSKQYKKDIEDWCPEAPIFTEARQRGIPVLALHDSGSAYTRFLLGETNTRASWTFKAGEFEVKFRPDFSSHCEPDRYYGNLEVYHAATHHPVFWGVKSIIALNNIIDLLNRKETVCVGYDDDGNEMYEIVEPFARLRFLRTNDLISLMKCNAQDLEGNCQMFLKEYAKRDVGQPMPDSVDDFVSLVQEAVKEFETMPLEGDPDAPDNYYMDTFETVKCEHPVVEKIRKIPKLIVKKIEGDTEEVDETSDKPIYKVGIRHHWKLSGFSYKYGLSNTPIATFAQDVKSMEEMSREQGKSEKDEHENKIWSKVIMCIIVMGVIIFGIIALVKLL